MSLTQLYISRVDETASSWSPSDHHLSILTYSWVQSIVLRIQKLRFSKQKTRVLTGTRGRSETSLNTVVHENVKVYMNQYVKFFLKFP